ncbi:MAG: DUF1858 domain-containing protein [Clostridiales bacterium]|nr:DUF1858 domain-containing protein [Clostridiales bacterium]
MSTKLIDLEKTVYELCNEDSELLGILDEIGFHDITKPGMLSTVGRFMTIKKGSLAKKIDLQFIKDELFLRGYEIKE